MVTMEITVKLLIEARLLQNKILFEVSLWHFNYLITISADRIHEGMGPALFGRGPVAEFVQNR